MFGLEELDPGFPFLILWVKTNSPFDSLFLTDSILHDNHYSMAKDALHPLDSPVQTFTSRIFTIMKITRMAFI